MESDLGKLFIGGISWNTDENLLREYFGQFGEVIEAMIMRDRATGRARGFGFIVFSDPTVTERVVAEKHIIDGRTVEAKKAVPRDDQQIINRTTPSIQGSPNPVRTKKIFVGGLPSTITESDFKNYFDQFGTITDVVVMYDHNTQRPRGFGFITYDSEEAVDRALHKTFHELNGKMVEVKKAVPKELSPSPNRSSLVYGLRGNNLFSSYPQGYNLNSIGGFGRFSPIGNSRNTFSTFGSLNYGLGMNLDQGLNLNPSFGGTSNFSNSLGYGRVLSPYYSNNANRYSSPIGYTGYNIRNDSILSSPTRNILRNSAFNLGSENPHFGGFGNSGASWGSSLNNGVQFSDGILGRNIGPATSSFAASGSSHDGSYDDLYRGGSVYGDSAWRSAASEVDVSGSFGYGFGDSGDVKGPEEYNAGYSIANR